MTKFKGKYTPEGYLIFNSDETLVFTGLDSKGEITTDESKIVAYMVGDGTSTYGNGLKEKKIQGVIEIPNTYKWKKVIKIGQEAFRGATNIIKINTGKNVQAIEIYAFSSMTNLKEVIIGKKVKTMGDTTRWSKNIEKVTFLNKDGNCNEKFCFQSLKCKFDVEGNNKLKVVDNILYSADGKKLLLCPTAMENINILDTVETIGDFAFYGNSNITSIVIPDSVKNIERQAFYDMGNLKEITIGKNVTNLGSYVFQGDKLLHTVIINSKTIANNLKTQSSMSYLVNYATTIYIKEGITNIGSYVTDNFKNQGTLDIEGEKYVEYVKK